MRSEKEIFQRLSYILATSFTKIERLSWNGNSISLNNEDDNSFLLVADYSGSALIKLNSKPYFSLDGYHNYFPLPKGEIKIEAEFSPFKAFGERVEISYGTPYKFVRNDSAFIFWLYGISLLELSKYFERDEILKILSEALKFVPFVGVSADQLYLASKVYDKFPTYLLSYGYSNKEEYTTDYTEAINFLKEKLKELNYKRGIVYAIGHAHTDTAWLWNFDETRRKIARTFSTVLSLMEKYDFVFMQSMAIYYDWIKSDYPSLFEKIKEKVKEGKWILGAGWVEFDANLPSGESIARQLLYSQLFYKENFGKYSEILWLPDTFGFSAQLPQIARLSKIKYFATHKVFWNDTNKFPYSLFNWVGIDGSSLKAIAFGNGGGGYNSTFTIDSLMEQWNNWKDKDQPMLYAYGYGDGGGGPTEEMLIKKKIFDNLPFVPKIKDGFPFEANPKEEWVGELYLETHRGVLTSHSRMKYLHRRAEISLREAEIWSTIAGNYDKEKIQSLWKILLKNEFHDVLPGSAINEVYKTVYPELEYVIKESEKITMESIKKLVGDGDECLVFNSLSWEREDFVNINGKLIKVKVPPLGFSPCKEEEVKDEVKVEGLTLENSKLLVKLDKEGHIISIYDKEEGREVLRERSKLSFYESIPGWADAWDIEPSYKETEFELKAKSYTVTRDKIKSCITFTFNFRKSDVIEEICLYAEKKMINVKLMTKIPDRELLLKFWVKTNLNANEAVFEIPYGVLKRSTIKNTSWEKARFEVPFQKWLDISEDNYGVGIVTDGKYGVSVERGDIGVTISKTPIFPDYETDSEENEVNIYIIPHKDDWKESEIYKLGYELNIPLIVTKGKLKESKSFISLKGKGLILETLKLSEDNKGIIIRLYNVLNSKGKGELTLWFNPSKVISTNIIEDEEVEREMIVKKNKVEFSYKNYEILTLKVY
ncbi:alpha-mannosidase [Sulfurisphaera javensis]|uniref:Alpha-mannosidase n=1 Tax=Sulfurisphaera javensis TaxID=2049879 RepID=A0AAT9GME8_9CREN